MLLRRRVQHDVTHMALGGAVAGAGRAKEHLRGGANRPEALNARQERRLPIEVHVLNPRKVKWFRHLELKDTKTDRVDAELIARFMAKIRPQPRAIVPEGCTELQEATRTRTPRFCAATSSSATDSSEKV